MPALVIAPLSQNPTSEALKKWLGEWYEPCLFFPNQSWSSFYRPRREERLSRPSWLIMCLDGLPVQVLTGPGID